MRDVPGEKPLVPLLGRPMIDWALDALLNSEGIGTLYVSVSHNVPQTMKHLAGLGIEVIMTSGTGYVFDLGEAMNHLRSDDVLVCPADMPLITSQGIEEVLEYFRHARVASLSVAVPSSIVRSIGAIPSYTVMAEGREVVLCGVSVVDRELMLSGNTLSQGFMITEDEQFALNVNTREELNRAESLLRRRRKK
ncbi:MAG: NTP transferase domain-containing protein [Euryarchaeota archaeon]|nr:NTP transferase domain-containing protein [Euryarchaeota archaeon]